MKENSDGNDTNVGSIGNSIEEDIKMVEDFIDSVSVFLPKYSTKKVEKIIDEESYIAIKHILLDYKRVLKENEELNNRCKNLDEEAQAYVEELMGDSTLKDRIINRLNKENEELKSNSNDSVVAIKLYSLQKDNEQLRTEVNSLKEENEELKADNYELDNRITDLLENIPKSKLKDIIDRIDYDIKKTKEIISKNTNIYASYRKNDYQIVRLRAMNTKSLDIKKRLQELLESEE